MNATRNQIEMPDSWSDPLSTASEKVKYPRALALDVARELCPVLMPLCVRGLDGHPLLKVCGSLRRGKEQVGDVEIVFVPRVRVLQAETRDLFGAVFAPQKTEMETHALLDELVRQCWLSRRLKSDGTQTWGSWIRLAVHVASGVPVDFFACTDAAWWKTVAVRTGGARSNVAVASAALAKGWNLDSGPEGPGFWRAKGLAKEWYPVTREADFFELVGMPCLRPEDRP